MRVQNLGDACELGGHACSGINQKFPSQVYECYNQLARTRQTTARGSRNIRILGMMFEFNQSPAFSLSSKKYDSQKS